MFVIGESLVGWIDRNVPDISTNGIDRALLELSTSEALNVYDDFLSKLKRVRITCSGRDKIWRKHLMGYFGITNE